MIRNYLLISIRNLRKHFTYSAINIVGLGLGLATCLLLVAWIRHELSYDRFHANARQLYRASLEYSFGGQTSKTSVSPTALLPALQKNFPEVQNGARVYNPSTFVPYIVRKDDKVFQETKFYFADSSFFEIFSYPLLAGSATYALREPRSIVLSESMAKKYFGTEDPIGKVLQINNHSDYKVTGVMKDVPSNSLLQFDCIASFSTLDAARQPPIWWSANYQTFLLVAPNTNITSLQEKTNTLVKKELASELTHPGDYVHYNFIPLTDIYLKSDMGESEATSSIRYMYGFGGIAALILLIACINYINLATARATDRAKEVGIRKVVGAFKRQLFLQFIGESLVITFLAFVLAFLIAAIVLPVFNSLTGKNFSPALFLEPSFLAGCFAALWAIAILAGAYPAVAISAFKPIRVLKGNFRSSGKGIWLRQFLVVLQFCISIILIVGTIVISKQMRFIQQVRLGYNKENVVVLPLDGKTAEVYAGLRSELMRSGKVQEVGRASESPTKINGGYSINLEQGNKPGMIVTAMDVDTSFIPTLGMHLMTGRNFNDGDEKRHQTDTVVNFILNQSAIRELGLTDEEAIGKRARLNGRKGEIVGIVEDFHFASLHSHIGPLVFFNEGYQFNHVFIKLKPGNPAEALASLKKICTSMVPHRPFEYEFVDQKFNALYEAEYRIGAVINAFAFLAIAIACLGLLGLVAFSAAQRTKEIGIRKVMGASASNIVLLITQGYTRLILVSILLGLPLSYWLVEQLFLNSFAYRTVVGAWPFVWAATTCLVIAFATASYQALKAAFLNPSETLRNE